MPRDLLAGQRIKPPPGVTPPEPGANEPPPEPRGAGEFRGGLMLNTRRGADPLTRAVVSIKTTPEGKVSALEALGHEAITDKSGAIYIIDRKNRQIYPVNEEQFTLLGDPASITGEAIETAPTLTGPGKLVSQGVRGSVGSALRQGVSELLPGADFPKSVMGSDELLNRAGQVGTAGAFATAGQGVANIGGAALRAVFNPSAFVSRRLQSLEARPAAQRGRQIERQTGVTLTPGQRTQSKGLLTIEGMLRRHPGTADIVESREAQQLNRALDVFNRNLDTLTRRDVSPEGVGNAVRQGFGQVVDRALDIRSKQGRVDFGRVDDLLAQVPPAQPADRIEAARAASLAMERGGLGAGRRTQQRLLNPPDTRNIFATPETQSVVRELIDEMAIEGATPQVIRGVVRELRNLEGLLTSQQWRTGVPPRTMQQLLQLWGKAAQGTGRVFKDIDRAQERMIAGRIFGALQRDLDVVVDAADESLSPQIAQALKTARDNWRENSRAIGELKDSVLSRFVGADAVATRDPEAIAQSLVRANPSALRASMEILNRADPELAQQVKKFAFADALEKAGQPLSRTRPQMMGEEPFSPARLVTALKKSPVWDVLTPVERNRLAINAELFGRIARKEGQGSPTGPLLFAWDLVRALGGQAARMDLTGAAATLSGVVSSRKVAEVMFDPKATTALRTMFNPKVSNPRRTRAALTLGALLAAGESRADVRPDEQGLLSTAASSRAPRDLLEGQGPSPR